MLRLRTKLQFLASHTNTLIRRPSSRNASFICSRNCQFGTAAYWLHHVRRIKSEGKVASCLQKSSEILKSTNVYMYQSTHTSHNSVACRENEIRLRFKPRSCRDQVSHRKYNLWIERKSMATMFTGEKTTNPTSLWQSLWQTKLRFYTTCFYLLSLWRLNPSIYPGMSLLYQCIKCNYRWILMQNKKSCQHGVLEVIQTCKLK